MKKNKTVYKKSKKMKYFGIPFLLILLWLFFTVWYILIFDQSALVLSYGHDDKSFTSFTSEPLLKGDKVAGKFVAQENNLGIVAFRFQKFERVAYKKEDLLQFRLKQVGEKEWYYVNNYRSGFIYDLPILPIGFPLITDSKGKTYQFEIESLKGNSENAMALSRREPILFSKYQSDKSQILSSPNNLFEFGAKKFINSLQTIDIFYSSFVFLLPLIFYLLWISPLKKSFLDPAILWLKERGYIPGSNILKQILEYILLSILSFVIAIDIFILQVRNDLLYIIIILIWLILFKGYKLDSRFTFITALACLLFASLFLQLNMISISEKSAAWAFMFLLTGVIQEMYTQLPKKVK